MEPTELTAGVVTGWALAWAMITLGIPPVPSLMLSLIVCAAIIGHYRRRWQRLPSPETE